MDELFCELFLKGYTHIAEFEKLRSTYLANCALDNFLCYAAIMLNIVTIHAIRRTSSLPKTLKTLLLSLAVSDVGVGLVVLPFYTSLLVKTLQQNSSNCTTYNVFFVTLHFLSITSFLGVVAVSVDRFLAIHLHLRYQELVTHKRVFAVVISIWVSSALFSLARMWFPAKIHSLVLLICGVIALVLTAVVYIRIYLSVKRHKNQIQALQVQQAGQTSETTYFASLIKSAVGIFYVYLLFFACYLPLFIFLVAFEITGTSIALKKFSFFSLTFVFLNSSLNPVIYCWKMRHVRHSIVDILRNMSWLRSRTSH